MLIQLYFFCTECRKVIVVPFRETDRSALERKIGPTYSTVCGKCSRTQTVSINKIRARPHWVVGLILILSILVALVLVWLLFKVYWTDEISRILNVLEVLGVVLGIPILVGFAFTHIARNAADTFNRYSVRE